MGPGSVTDSLGESANTLVEQDEVAYPCKGCGEVRVLEADCG